LSHNSPIFALKKSTIMSKRESISRYSLIINRLRRGDVTLKEIKDYLSRESELQGYNFNISQRTFQRDLEDIRSLYDIDIQFDFGRKVYYIDSDEQSGIQNKILEAFDVINALNISQGLSPYIHLEKRRPQGTENLHGLLHAIQNKLQIKFDHQKFWEDEITDRKAAPYALKEFKNRWYVLAKDYKDSIIKSFGLDRLSNLEITNTKFEVPKGYNVEESFRYCFGIITPNEGVEPQDIILSFDAFQGKYIKTLPLHETQKILIDTDDELQISLKLYLTKDLIMELLSYGEDMKVLKPKSLADKIKGEHKKAAMQY